MNKTKRLKIYFISSEYIDYLRNFDNKVAYNKNMTRPYIGIVYTYNNFNYFVPLSSPKEKHLKMEKNIVDIWKIEDGKLGIINFNNMIPCPIEVLLEAIPNIKDLKYKKLLENQISSINANRDLLLKKINRFQKHYRQKRLYKNILDRCCDFKLLEEKSLKYKK